MKAIAVLIALSGCVPLAGALARDRRDKQAEEKQARDRKRVRRHGGVITTCTTSGETQQCVTEKIEPPTPESDGPTASD